jgi:multiple antibiotic resistance protein
MDLKPLITLLALVNPLGIVPFFISFTQDYSREHRRRTIWVAALTVFIVIASSAVLGLRILDFFSVSLASFQVGGGILLMMGSMSMLNAQPAEAKNTQGEEVQASRASIAVVPLAIPLLTGPATMSTVVILAEKAKSPAQLALLLAYGAVVALAVVLVFSASTKIARALGKTGINVMTRVMGLILAALSVELMHDGLVQLFPVLGR